MGTSYHVTVEGGYNSDLVDRWDEGTTLCRRDHLSNTGRDSNQVTRGSGGVSRILTRPGCWVWTATTTRTSEDGYLTEPYKVVSLVDGTSGLTPGK